MKELKIIIALLVSHSLSEGLDLCCRAKAAELVSFSELASARTSRCACIAAACQSIQI